MATAAVRKLYDELIVGEPTAFVVLMAAAWDVIISADTLVYFAISRRSWRRAEPSRAG